MTDLNRLGVTGIDMTGYGLVYFAQWYQFHLETSFVRATNLESMDVCFM
jgi:hypothetical protein